VGRIPGAAHDRDDLFDGGRIGGILKALVARRATAMKAGHGRRRTRATSSIENNVISHAESVLHRRRRRYPAWKGAAASKFVGASVMAFVDNAA
jgi:hypothetical protein